MTAFKLTIAYDGTDFVGWQRQAAGTSIQGLLESALAELDGREVEVAGAGRTDAGVHALGQVAGATVERAIDGGTLVSALNARLPDTVRVVTAEAVDGTFHARFHATEKAYRYRIWNAPVMSPFEQRYAWHLPGPLLNTEDMSAAARCLVGHHDFAAFQGTGSDVQSTERRLTSLTVAREGAALVVVETTGGGFLRHMVRNIVGTLVDVGRGRQPVAWVEDVLQSRDRSRAGPTAPARGLFLVRVDYD